LLPFPSNSFFHFPKNCCQPLPETYKSSTKPLL
jgi:hypothetical protein